MKRADGQRADDRTWAARALFFLRVSYALELVLLTLTTLVVPAPGREPSLVIWLVLVVPLLLFLPALWKGWVRNMVWLCFLILLYFTAAVTECFVPGRLAWGLVEVVLTVTLFGSGLCYIRWGSRAARLKTVNG